MTLADITEVRAAVALQRRCLRGWHQIIVRARRLRRAANHFRMLAAARALARWREQTAELSRMRAQLDRALANFRNRALSAAWRRWVEAKANDR